MAQHPGRRPLAGLLAGTLLITGLGALLPLTASAASTQLFYQPFHNTTADGDGAVVLPAASASTVTNVACLTAAGNTTVVPKSCSTATDTAGAGKLRLTSATTNQAGGLFAATSVPTSQGLDVTFNTYQYSSSTNPADGIAFALAAVDPTNPLSPANMGPVGGALGYAYANGSKGLAYGYLGVGFDVFGNYSNTSYQGTTAVPGSTATCANPAYLSTTGQVKGQVVVRGPGNGSVGYCALNSTATSTTSAAVALRASTRAAAKVPVEVVINPGTTAITTASGITVPAKNYAVQFTPAGATTRTTLSGALPTVNSALYPSNFLDASGYPKQLAFGFVGSTGSLTDYHEIDEGKVISLNAVPELTVSQTAYTQPTLSPGDPVSYVVATGVQPGATETAAVSVTDTLPAGVTPTGGYGSGWVCSAPSGQKITCTNSSAPFAAGSTLPSLTITGTVTGTGVTPAVVQSNSIVTASSNDANPAYSNTAAAGTATSVPTSLAIAPASGPTGTPVTITGTNTGSATAVQIGTSAELAAGTGTTYTQCAGNTPAAGCFTIDATTGALSISAMPAHAVGAVQVKVITLGSAGTVAYSYTSVPGTPAVTARAGALSATVTWSAPASGGSDITGYTVTPYKDGVAQTAVPVAATATSYTLSGATAGSSYTFTVSAKNTNGTGLTSAQTSAVVPYTVPGAPTVGSATAGTSAARLSWTAPTSNGFSAITGYVVTPYLNGAAQTAQTFGSTATTQTVTGLTAGRSYTFTVAAVNAAGTGPASAQSGAVTVNDGPSISSTPGGGEVGVAYNQQLAVTGGTGPFAFDLTTGTLPAGLTLSSSGLLSGTPTADGSSTVTVKVTDSYGTSSTRTLTLVVVAAPSLTYTSPLPRGDVGSAYSQTLTRTGGTGPFTYAVTAGTLPGGLTLNPSSGVLSGTPTRSGDFSFTVKLTDALGQSDTKATTLSVRGVPGAPTIGSVTAGTTTATVRWTAPTDDGNSPVTGYVVTPYLNGVAQTPLAFGSTATTQTLTGLSAGGPYTFTVAATNALGTGAPSAPSAAVRVNAVPSITGSPGDGEVGAAYSQQLTATGGTGALSFEVASGSLPDGLSLSSAGLLSGTPTTVGSAAFKVRVTDANGASSTRDFTVVVVAAPVLSFDAALPDTDVGVAYSQTLTRSGGTGPFTFSVSAGTLPAGLSLDPATGVLSGTATASGNYAFTVKVTDALGQSDTRAATLAVRTVPAAPALGSVTAGTGAVTVRWTTPTTDGNSPITGYLVTPYLDGVAQTPHRAAATATRLTVTGLTAGSSYTFTVAALNAIGTGPESARSAVVVPNAGPVITSTLGTGEVGVAYSQQVTSTGGTGTVTYTVSSGALPDGLTLSSAGLVSGTPTTAGSATFRVRATDADGDTSTKSFTVEIKAAPNLTFDATLPDADRGRDYSTDLSRTGGTGPFTFTVSSGTLPAGLSLDAATGTISGTPTRGGSYTFTVQVTDALGQSDTRAATLLVRAPAEVVLTVSDAAIRFGSAVNLTATLAPTSATGTVTFTATAPDGSTVELGSATATRGVATLTTTPDAFGTYTVTAAYGGDATHLAGTSAARRLDVNGYVGEAVITEFRTSGPKGADDSYVELYNPGPALPLAGLVLESSSGTKTVLPADAPVLGRYRTYLVAGQDFSLGGFATPDLTRATLGTGGLRLVIPDATSTVTDAVGPGSGFHLGAALPALAGTPTEQWAFVRVEKAGRPVNNGENASDFALVSTSGGKVGGVQSMRGSASPTGLGDDWQHNGQALSYLLDSTQAVEAVPNRAYVVGKPGTLEVRRTITNTGTTTITSAKARVTALSEANGLRYNGSQPATVALIRAVQPRTTTSTVQVAGRGAVTVRNLAVDTPVTDAGGGLNSTFTIPLPSGGLAPGASVDVAFTFDVDTRGTFWFGYDVDARTSSGSALRTPAKALSQAQLRTQLEKAGKSPSRAVSKVTTGTL